uniref:Uncharacterized protein n=1 Tax=Siphoviridae sp. ctrfD19 TaxID=2826478 RepID=A0A8S5M257_9CAUD|nr:MAG TPA: hypothetical protein [Siphoviridae sp. ctrfD19]DAY88152.1 MAG TPA: hypothetical protein [Caudoviricetes sp.]
MSKNGVSNTPIYIGVFDTHPILTHTPLSKIDRKN